MQLSIYNQKSILGFSFVKKIFTINTFDGHLIFLLKERNYLAVYYYYYFVAEFNIYSANILLFYFRLLSPMQSHL